MRRLPLHTSSNLGCIAIKTNTLGQILLNADYFVRFWNIITNTRGPLQNMFTRNDCVGCKAPLVDETVEGDLRDGSSDEIDFENARDNKTFANMVVGSENGCRNCMLFLDASSFISTSKDQKRCRFTMTPRRRNRILGIYFKVLGDGETASPFMQVFRQSSMSD
jgi:hypothetical protein